MWRAKAWRIGKWAIVAVLALELLYLIAANTLLRTRILRNLIAADKGDMDVAYDSAWSFVPGVVHVQQLTIRGREESIEWRLHIDESKFRVVLLDLARRRFHTSYTNVDGVELRIRLRLHPEEALPDVVAALPDIEGFKNPPLLDPQKPPEEPDVWKIDLEEIDLHHAREVWIHSMHYSGDVNVRGRWAMVPDSRVEVGPAHVEIVSLVASYGNAPIGTAIHGTAEFTIEDVGIDVADAAPPVLRAMSISGTFDGEGHTSAGLTRLIGQPGLRLLSGKGPTHAEVNLVRGVFFAPTVVSSELADVSVQAGKEDLTFAAKTSTSFERTDVGLPHPRLALSDTEVAITDLGFTHADMGVLARASAVTLKTGSLTIARGEGAKGLVDVRAPNVALADASRFRKLLGFPDSVVLEHGAATAAIGLDVDTATLTFAGEARVHVPALTLKIEERTMNGDLLLRMVAKRAGNATDLSTSRLAFNEARSDPWFLSANADKAALVLLPSLRLTTQLSGAARDASPGGFWVQAVTKLPALPGDQKKSDRVEFHGAALATHTMLALQNFVATCGATSARVSYCTDKGGAVGSAVIGAVGAHVTIDLADKHKPDLHPADHATASQASECAHPGATEVSAVR